MSNNTYASAAGHYDKNAQSHTPDPRELEARVLLKSAKNLIMLRDEWDNISAEGMDDILRYNRQIWMMFVDNAASDENSERGSALRQNIASLGNFIFKHTIDILAKPEKSKLDVLIDINREIAAGLMERPKVDPALAAQSSEQAEAPKGLQSPIEG
jgi:flagellar protein FlaF